MALNPKQKLFVKEYLLDKNASRAARAAGYSKKTAGSQAHELLKNREIAQQISSAINKELEQADLKASDVLAELRKIAFVDLSEAFDKDGKMLHPKDMPAKLRASLQSAETDEIAVGRGSKKRVIGRTCKIKLSDKVRALELFMKYYKLLTDVQEVSGKDGGPQVIVNLPGNGSESTESLCRHRWATRIVGADPSTAQPGEAIIICKLCGDTPEYDDTEN